MSAPSGSGYDLKDLEVKIEKYPMAESPRLLENFLIIGYEDTYLQEVIYKNIQNIINQDPDKMEKYETKMRKGSDTKGVYREYKCRNLPTILGSISSNFDGSIFDCNQIIEEVFPVPPSIYYAYQESTPNDSYNIVFTNIQNNVVNIGYGYSFFEIKSINKLKLYIPKAFVIISQYPLFNIFNQLCIQIKKLFSLDQLEIPIEIQIYNIVNFTPAPINSSMKMTLIPSEELFIINRFKNSEEFINLNKQEKYFLEQLSGYRCSDINFSELFSVLSVETIIEVYLEFLSGKIIGFFSKHIEILNMTMYIFQQFFFPLSPNESVAGLSPLKFFCSENIDQYIVGFTCGYEDLENHNPFRELKPGEFRCMNEEDEKKDLDPLLFKCDYILDLDKKILKEQDKYCCDTEMEKNKNNQKLNEYFKKVIGGSINNNSSLDFSIAILHQKLKEISYKLTSYQHNNSSLPKFINSESNDTLNRAILNAFYYFNLNISYLYYLRVSTYNGDYTIPKEEQDKTIKTKEQSGLNDDEYLFFSSFSNSFFCNVLGNFVGGYSKKEPTIYKTPKRIFEKLITLKKIWGSKDDCFKYILDIYDSVYIDKNIEEEIIPEKGEKNSKKNEKSNKKDKDKNQKKNELIKEDKTDKKEDNEYKTIITFLEFYKFYYSTNVANYIYYITNSDLVIKKVNKNNKNNIKYTYKYKKIEFDQNFIIKYIYLINNLDEESKKRYFQLTKDDIQTKQIISSSFISSCIEKFYIRSKIIDHIELIRFSVMGIVALTASRHTLLHFTAPVYEMMQNLKVSTRKFIEIILSISLRLFSKEEDKNLFIYEPYFNIYNEAIVKKQIFPNDELIILEQKISEFTKTIDKREEIQQPEYLAFLALMNPKEKKNFLLEYDKKKANDVKASSYNYGVRENKVKITFKLKNINKKYDCVYSFMYIYNMITEFLNEYYKTLDYSKIDKEEFNKIIIYLIFYITILNENNLFPKELNKFLLYCLDFN